MASASHSKMAIISRSTRFKVKSSVRGLIRPATNSRPCSTKARFRFQTQSGSGRQSASVRAIKLAPRRMANRNPVSEAMPVPLRGSWINSIVRRGWRWTNARATSTLSSVLALSTRTRAKSVSDWAASASRVASMPAASLWNGTTT